MAMHEDAAPGEQLDGFEVALWTDLQTTAEWLGVSDRQVMRYELKGLPARGEGTEKRYAWPHTHWWFSEYQIEVRLHGVCHRLSLQEAHRRDKEFWREWRKRNR